MTILKISDAIGSGVQLFRVRSPEKHFVELAELSPLPELFVGRRRVWKTKEGEAWYAVLTIPYKDEEEILVRAPHGRWEEWDWKVLAAIADGCRWRGSQIDSRHVF
jgi:hypothetical protein